MRLSKPTPTTIHPRHRKPATIATLASGDYLSAGDPIVLLGDSGTGKSHLLIALGLATCEEERRLRYVTAAQLTNELDELGYVQLDTRGSELFFQILTEREERSSIAVASNLPFSEWAQVIPDPRLAGAVIDRLTFNAHIIETGTNSYRLRAPRARRSRGAKTNEHAGANPG